MTRKPAARGRCGWYVCCDIRSGPAFAGSGNLGRITRGAFSPQRGWEMGSRSNGTTKYPAPERGLRLFLSIVGGNNFRHTHKNKRTRTFEPPPLDEWASVVDRIHDPSPELDQAPRPSVAQDRRSSGGPAAPGPDPRRIPQAFRLPTLVTLPGPTAQRVTVTELRIRFWASENSRRTGTHTLTGAPR